MNEHRWKICCNDIEKGCGNKWCKTTYLIEVEIVSQDSQDLGFFRERMEWDFGYDMRLGGRQRDNEIWILTIVGGDNVEGNFTILGFWDLRLK